MAEIQRKLFKGFKQVTWKTFNGTSEQDKLGYIWFVRTPLNANGAAPDTENVDDKKLENDSYDIYFGTKHYGHYMEGEVPALATALQNIKEAIGLDNNYDFIPSPDGLKNELKGNNTVKAAIDYIFNHKVDNEVFNNYKKEIEKTILSKAAEIEYYKSGSNHFLTLQNSNKERIGTPINVNEFIADGILKSAELAVVKDNKETIGEKAPQTVDTDSQTLPDGTYIKLSFNGKGAGTKKPIYLDVNGLIDVYEAGNGISIVGNTVSAKVKEADKYIKVTASGIESQGIDNVVKTQNEIKPIGVTVGNISASNPIPAGKTLEEVLKMMLQKTIGITVNTNPSVSMEGDYSRTVEKGTTVSPTFTVTFSQGSYKGAEEGYSYSAPTVCAAETPTMVGGGEAKVVSAGSKWSFTPGSQVITESKSFKATITYGDDTNSELKNNMGEKVQPMVKGKTISTGTVTYTPEVKWFIGSTTDLYTPGYWTEKSEIIRSFGFKDYVTTKSKEYTFPQGAKQQVIAVPAGRTFTAFTKTGDNTAAFRIKETIDFTNAVGHTESYDVYVAPANDGLAAGSWMKITLI